MEKRLQESELISTLVDTLTQKQDWGISSVEWIKLYESLSTSTYEYLSLVKNKEKKTALVFNDNSEAKNFIMAAIIEFHKAGDSDEVGGNWSFEYTFNPADVQGCDLKYSTDTQFLTVFNDVSFRSIKDENGESCGFLVEPEDAVLIFDALIRYLKMYLDSNAKEGEVLDLVLEDHFKASVAIEDGIKVMGMAPCGAAKAKIKNDDIVAEEE